MATSKNNQSRRPSARANKPAAGQRRSSQRKPAQRKPAQRATHGHKPAQQPARQPLLSPQQQREAFAFALIAVGLLLLVLINSVNPGAFGASVVAWLETAFGNAALLAPVLLMIIGGLIIWQEQFEDAPVSGANVAGVVLLVLTLLAGADFNATRAALEDGLAPPRSIGGIIDTGLINAFGEAGAAVLLGLAAILGIMFTFNVGLRQLIASVRHGVEALWHLLRGPKVERLEDDELDPEPVPFAEELKAKRTPRPPLNGGQPTRTSKSAAEAATAAAEPPAPQRPMVLTPIAERPTQAELFERIDVQLKSAKADALAPLEQPTQTTPESEPQPPAQAKLEPKPASKPAQPPEPKQEEIADLNAGGPRQAWPLPPVALLDAYSEYKIDNDEKRVKARVIEHTLASFKIEAQVVGMRPGPAVTQYQLQPAVGVKVSRIMGLEKDLALALAAPSIRIEAPIPGTPYIGIEIPNRAIASVSMRETMDTDEFRNHQGKLRITVGKDVSGTPVVTDLTKAPHLLIAGATGAGKSIAVNAIICTLLMQHTPDELKFIMVDPKMVELVVYNHVPHLLAPVVTELERVVSLLKWAVREMERRYKLLAQKGFRNIESYNKIAKQDNAGLEPLPYIVIIIDELADLMMLAPDEVETLICRLAQMARAIGIHLILATQRPSVDVVTGLIKANFPTRMAFAVTSQIDSRVILDTMGAEQLLGKGDMLYLASDAAKPVRVQGTYVSDREIEEITRLWRAAAAEKPTGEKNTPQRKPLPLKPAANGTDGAAVEPEAVGVSPLPAAHTGQLSPDEQDELLPKAIQLVKQHDRASASLLQRRLRIGYSKAAQLLDMLEQQGIVGPPEDGRSREVVKNVAPEGDS
jgi:S-DNA-T family DNA segregation ATPase FtsK/SpoIIIE